MVPPPKREGRAVRRTGGVVLTLSAELIESYKNADYVVFGDPGFVLRIGEPSPLLDDILDAAGATTAAFITGANPGSAKKSAADNGAATATLVDLLSAAGYPHFPGEGRDPEGRWPAEPSVLVIGIYRENAKALGHLFGQSAIVFVEKGGAPELVLL